MTHDHDRFERRKQKHDALEPVIADIIRPYTCRRHLPDRLIGLNNKVVAWDLKTGVFVEDNSHDEYFALQKDNNIPVFIVYHDKGERLAGWIDELQWSDKKQSSEKSTSGDDYYIISGGIPLEDFLIKGVTHE